MRQIRYDTSISQIGDGQLPIFSMLDRHESRSDSWLSGVKCRTRGYARSLTQTGRTCCIEAGVRRKKRSLRCTTSPTGSTQWCPRPFVSSVQSVNSRRLRVHTHAHVRNYDMCKLVSQFRARKPDPPSLTEIDGRNFYAVLLRVETIDTILLTTTSVCYQSSRRIYRRR